LYYFLFFLYLMRSIFSLLCYVLNVYVPLAVVEHYTWILFIIIIGIVITFWRSNKNQLNEILCYCGRLSVFSLSKKVY
jgi:hypothetical protein